MWCPAGHLPFLSPSQPQSSPNGSPVRGLEPIAQRILREYVFHGLSTYFVLEARGSKSKNYETTSTKINDHKALEIVLSNGPRTPPPKAEGQSLAFLQIPRDEDVQLTDLQSFNSFSWASRCSFWASPFFNSSCSTEHWTETRQQDPVGPQSPRWPLRAFPAV